MSPKSFRDILAQFLEEKCESTPISPSQNCVFHSQTADFPFVSLDTQTIYPGPGRAAYGKARPNGNWDSLSRKSEIEAPRELSSEGQKALDSFLRLGALDLESGLNETTVKRAYRRLLKFYHPDHYPFDLNDEERRLRTENFLELQRAFKALYLNLR